MVTSNLGGVGKLDNNSLGAAMLPPSSCDELHRHYDIFDEQHRREKR
jgi:hypothetical protein